MFMVRLTKALFGTHGILEHGSLRDFESVFTTLDSQPSCSMIYSILKSLTSSIQCTKPFLDTQDIKTKKITEEPPGSRNSCLVAKTARQTPAKSPDWRLALGRDW